VEELSQALRPNRKEVNLFTGHFDEDNTFKFRVKFNEDWEYVRFADELHDFVEEHRIDEYIRRINNEHWDTFKRISMDTSMLTSSEDDIQDVIREINKGFATCNFVGVIQRIEMYLYYPMRKYKVYAWHGCRLHITCCGLFLFYSLYQLQMEQSLRQIPALLPCGL
jgi:hypothetical protein